MEHRDDHRSVQPSDDKVNRIREAPHERAPNAWTYFRKLKWQLTDPEQQLDRPRRRTPNRAQAAHARTNLVPVERRPEQVAGSPARSSFLIVGLGLQLSLKRVPRHAFIRIALQLCEPFIQDSLMPRRHSDSLWPGRDALPDRLDVIDLFIDRPPFESRRGSLWIGAHKRESSTPLGVPAGTETAHCSLAILPTTGLRGV